MGRTISGQQVVSTDTAKQGAPAPITLSGASQALVAANKDRVALIVTAPAAAITLALGAPAAANNGIVVPPNTVFVLNGYTGAVNVIGTAAQVVAFAEI